MTSHPRATIEIHLKRKKTNNTIAYFATRDIDRLVSILLSGRFDHKLVNKVRQFFQLSTRFARHDIEHVVMTRMLRKEHCGRKWDSCLLSDE